MKLINVYKQESVNWFGYKCVFSYSHKLYGHRHSNELELESWIKKGHLGITKRKPNENN